MYIYISIHIEIKIQKNFYALIKLFFKEKEKGFR